MFTAVGAGNQMLAAILDPTERRSELPSEPGDAQLFRLQHAFVAEAAADVGRDHAHAALRDPEMLGDRGADHVRHLRRGMDHELVAARLPVRQHGLAFERVHRLPRHAVAAPHHDRRGQCDVGDALVERRLQKQVVLPGGVHQRGRRVTPRNRVDDGGQRFEVELHAPDKVLALGAGCGHAHRDRFTDEAHFAARQRRILGRLEAGQAELGLDRSNIEVLGDEDRRLRPRRLADGTDAGVGERAAQEGNLLQAGQSDVVDVAAAAAQDAGVLLAQDARADALAFALRIGHRAPDSAARRLNRLRSV
jgi:hypothetical protein